MYLSKRVIVAFLIGVLILIGFLLSTRNKDVSKVDDVKNKSLFVLLEDEGPFFAIVLDDCGYSKRNLIEIKNLDVPITLAVLPDTPYATYVAEFANENDLEVIVHMPMEPIGREVALEDSTILDTMTSFEIDEAIQLAVEAVPYAKGMNNHMGSKLTQDNTSMALVFDDLKKRDMYFLDSLTTDKSICFELAEEKGISCVVRDIFIDNSSDKDYILGKLAKAEGILLSGKDVIAIGHDRPNTIKALKEYVPTLKASGVKFVSLSEMVDIKKQKGVN